MLQGTPIVTIGADGTVTLSTGGWWVSDTVTGMNRALRPIGMALLVEGDPEDGQWTVKDGARCGGGMLFGADCAGWGTGLCTHACTREQQMGDRGRSQTRWRDVCLDVIWCRPSWVGCRSLHACMHACMGSHLTTKGGNKAWCLGELCQHRPPGSGYVCTCTTNGQARIDPGAWRSHAERAACVAPSRKALVAPAAWQSRVVAPAVVVQGM